MIGHAKAFLRVGRPGGAPPLRSGGGWVGAPLQKTPSSALSLPCEIVSISQGRPLLAPEFTQSGQEEAGKGLKIPVWRGSSLHLVKWPCSNCWIMVHLVRLDADGLREL
jgi:hypothetical protein